MRQDLIAGPAMHQRRRDVAHGARRHEHRGLLAEQIGHPFAQQIDRGIVADLLVADLGPRHRLAHAGVGRVWVSDNRLMRTGRALGSRGEGVYIMARFSFSADVDDLIQQKGPGKTGAFEIAKRRQKSARIEFDDQMRLHLHRERHIRQMRDAGELRGHLAVIDLEEIRHVALAELTGFENDRELL